MFKVNYQTVLPLQELSPSVTICNAIDKEYRVDFYDDNILIKSEICKNNSSVYGNRQWFTNWCIKIYNSENHCVYIDKFNLKDKIVFIKMDGYALGDNIAWFPYIEEFRKKHNCKIICSTFFNWLFESEYPNILFVQPNTHISNIYAQYYIGSNGKINTNYSPSTHLSIPLQQVSSDILGLAYKEIRPNISKFIYEKPTTNKYVCISEHASMDIKKWHEPNGWQMVVDFLNKNGYDVVVISKEPTSLLNVINKTGNIDLKNRISDILQSEFFIGVSSGLSWLAWALNKKVGIISNYTPEWHEPINNVIRIYDENVVKVIDNYEPITPIPINLVLKKIKQLMW